MIVKPFQFVGNCHGCGESPYNGAVAVGADQSDKDIYDAHVWLCMMCSLRLARRILKARKKCRENISAGLVFRDDKWRKPKGDS